MYLKEIYVIDDDSMLYNMWKKGISRAQIYGMENV